MELLAEWGAQLLSALRETVQGLITYLPAALTAAALLLVGWLLARLLGGLAGRAMQSVDWLFGRLVARSAEPSQALNRATSKAASSVVHWIVLLVFAVAALRTLGGSFLDQWTQDLLAYLPAAAGGAIIIIAGWVGGMLARHVVQQAAAGAGAAQSVLIGRLAQGLVVTGGLLVGIAQLGVDVTFLTQLATVAAAAVLGGIALAFALGTRRHLANLIGARYARKRYGIGDRIRVAGFEGRVAEIADGCVFLETEDGDVAVPARYFTRDPSVRLDGDHGGAE